ncbi:MAG: type VI secretion system baseplate subunit TssG [Pseudomonadota bacterium]
MNVRPPRPLLPDETGLLADLEERPERFDAATALRVAERVSGSETVRVETPLSPRLAASEVSGVWIDADGLVLRTSVTGLVGPLGPMPPHYGALARADARRRAKGFAAFFDVISAQMLRLFAGACEKYRLPALVRWHGISGQNGVAAALLALVGFATPGVRERRAVREDVLLRYGGLLSNRVRSAEGLRALLCEHTGLPVVVEEFRGRWLTLSEDHQTRLSSGGANVLGGSAVAGAHTYDRQSSFRLVIGPVRLADYRALEPGGARMDEIIAIARLYAGLALSFDVQVVLHKDDVPMARLDASGGPRLGWDAWARIQPMQDHARDTVVHPTHQATGTA